MTETSDTTYQGMREAEVEVLRRALGRATETLARIEAHILTAKLAEIEAELPAIQAALDAINGGPRDPVN